MAQLEAESIDKYVGPNADTGYGRLHIYAFSAPGPTGYIAPIYTLTNAGNPTIVGISPESTDAPTCCSLPNWAEPWTWDWGHIMGVIWDGIWNHCVEGAAVGIVGRAGGALIVNLLARGGKVFVGPWGYAAIAVGGCLVQAITGA